MSLILMEAYVVVPTDLVNPRIGLNVAFEIDVVTLSDAGAVQADS